MGIDFYLEDNIKDIKKTKRYVILEEEVNEFLYRNREFFIKEVEVLTRIDPYGDHLFEQEEIQKLDIACQSVINQKNAIALTESIEDYGVSIEDIIDFVKSLQELCREAMTLEKRIFSRGD